jgi:hypothetical protein
MKKELAFLLFVLPAFFSCRAFAALAIDASTPAAVEVVNIGPTTLTTASFTPPAGSVLYIMIGIDSSVTHANEITNVTDNLGAHLTYTEVREEGIEQGADSLSYLYTAVVTTSQAMTVSATEQNEPNNAMAYMKVIVVTGANIFSPVGASGGGRGAAGVISDTYNSSVNNSWGWLIYSDWNAQAVPTAGANQTVYDSYFVNSDDTYALIQQNSTTAAAGTSVTMNTTAPTSGAQTAHLYFEMKPVSVTTQSNVRGSSSISGNSTIY